MAEKQIKVNLNMGGDCKVTGLPTPTDPGDAVNKAYADALGGGGGSPGGTSGAMQFNNGGLLGGAENVRVEDQELRLPAIATPAPPAADGLKVFGKK